MERIKQIFHSLSKTELRYLKNYLSAFHTKGPNKALAIIKQLEKNPDISQDALAKKLYGDPKSKAFLMLKSRLMEKMLETLSLSINFYNNPNYKDDPAAFGPIELRKDIIYAMLLRRRGLDPLAQEILKKCIKKAEHLALPEFKLQALIHLRNMSHSEKEVLEEYKQAIDEALRAFETDVIGVGIFDEMRILKGLKSSNDLKYLALLEKAIEGLDQQLNRCYSERSYFYALNLKIRHQESLRNYEQSKRLLRELIRFVDANEGIKSRKRLGVPYLQLAAVEMGAFHFQEAWEASEQALAIFPPQTPNYYSALLYRLFACLYLGKLDEFQTYLQPFEQLEAQRPYDPRLRVSNYLYACHAYVLNDIPLAFQRFNELSALFSDKEGWNVGLRIFEVIMLIDLEKLDLAAARIETLRKHVARYDVDLRTELIYKYLYLLEKDSFDVGAPSEGREQLLREMNFRDPWVPLGHEVIRFDVWTRSRAQQQAFLPLFMHSLQQEVMD